MADVFISYSKQAPQPTRDLARDLEERGFTLWWDTELLAGDEFHDKIKREIIAAKIVIVIWSPASVKSSWVQAEANLASGQNKLLTVCTSDLDVREVPLPFNMLQTEKIANREKIVAAFAARGLLPRDEARAKMARRADELYQRAVKCRDGKGEPVDISKAVKLLLEAIELGHIEAKIALAGIYVNAGFGLKLRPTEALRLLFEAKATGHLVAGPIIGLMHLDGLGIAKDTQEGLRFLEEAADGNNPFAIFNLALTYHYGREGIPISIPLAFKYYERGAALGDPTSIYKLGVIYCDGDGVPQDWQRGVAYLKKASDLGWVAASVSLAMLMIEGIHTQRDVAQGLAILEREVQTAEGPYRAHALCKLGFVYLYGKGIERNARKGLDLVHQAAELGNAEAAGELGILYDEGQIVPRDESKALAFLERGAKSPHREAIARLGAIHVRRRNFEEGLKLLRDAERLGSGSGALGLAFCYQYGLGVARDLTEARRWLFVAGSRGHDVSEALRAVDKS